MRITGIKTLPKGALWRRIFFSVINGVTEMFKKMVAGELGLGITFWKFGVLFIALLAFVVKIFERLLYRQTKGVNPLSYFAHYFSPIKPDTMAILWSLCYAAAIIGFIYYVINFLGGIWRSSGSFERSAWLKNITRFFALVWVVVCVGVLF